MTNIISNNIPNTETISALEASRSILKNKKNKIKRYKFTPLSEYNIVVVNDIEGILVEIKE